MFKRYLAGLVFALTLGLAALPQASQAQTQAPNWFDPSAWGMAGQAQAMGVPQFNLAHPGGWGVFLNPNTYPAMMNPGTYGQFMQPQWWMQFANPNNMMAWMNPGAYGQFMNPASYMQWMNPGAYGPFMNPATYMQWMNPAAFAIPAGQPVAGATAFNWFDPNAWMQMMPQTAPAGDAAAAPADPKQGKK